MFLAEVVADGAVPTISESRRLRFSQRGDKSLNQRQAAGLAAGIATDVGHAAVRAVFQELLAQTGRIETVPLVRRRRRRRHWNIYSRQLLNDHLDGCDHGYYVEWRRNVY